MLHSRSLRGLLGGCLLLGLGACVPSGEVYVASTPPADRYEVVGAAPYPGAFWVRGHYYWSGYRYVWMGGHWERPRPGFVFEHGRWVRHGHAWVYAPGHWRRF